MARSVSNGAELIAIEKGYFKEVGIKVEMDDIDTSANTIALLAQNRLQIVAGGISAGYFNALEKDLPVTIIADRVSTPIGHSLMLRPDLKDQVKTLAGLKGKIVASNGTGSVSTYEVGKMLETAGLQISDVDVKIFPFTQMALAFTNKAIDAAIVIPPFVSQFLDQRYALGFAAPDALVKPTPMTIAVIMANTDWAKAHPALIQNYYTAYLRGVRDYCDAYHGAPIKNEIIALLIRHGSERRPELLHEYPWPARSPERPHQHREHARHAGLVRQERLFAGEIPGHAPGRFALCGSGGQEARALRSRQSRLQARRLPVVFGFRHPVLGRS